MKSRREIGVDKCNFYPELRHEIESRLKPCPLCGNSELEFALIHPQHNGKVDMDYWCYWEVLCPECGVGLENGRSDNLTWEEAMEETVVLWNRRTSDADGS